LQKNRRQERLPATGIKPGDYPLGSLESRVAARALALQERQPPVLSQYDQDALALYSGGWWTPQDAFEMSRIYKRGQELSELRFGPYDGEQVNAHSDRSCFASLQFELINHREPVAGDVLTFLEVKALTAVYESHFNHVADAWARQFPGVPLLSRFENGRHFRLRVGGKEQVWEEDTLFDPQRIWLRIERELRFPQTCEAEVRFEDMPTIPAVVFLGVQDGQHRCKAATTEAGRR